MLKEPQQVVELAVDVAHDLDGRLQLQQRGLVDRDCGGLVDEEDDLVRRQTHVRAGLFCAPKVSKPRWQDQSLLAADCQGPIH